MSLLDRIRPVRPAWEDPDAETRLAAVRQLPAAERDLLSAIAREDAEAAVRRAAVRKLDDVALLESLAGDGGDQGVREEAAQGLLRVALSGDEAAARALDALSQPRQLSVAARQAPSAELRAAALGRLSDERSLRSVAKGAEHADSRLAALERLSEARALAEVAEKSEHRDVAVAAVERLDDVENLRRVAARGRHRAAARRARARLEELTGAPQPVTAEERRAADLGLCRRLEPLETSVDFDEIAEQLAAVVVDWDRLAGHEQDLAARFHELREGLEHRLARQREQEAERERHGQQQALALSARIALCERVEGLDGEAAPEALDTALGDWRELASAEGEAFAQAQERFDRAVREWRARHEARVSAGERGARLSAACDELDSRLAEERDEGTGARRAEARELAAGSGLDAELIARHAALESRWSERAKQRRQERTRLASESLERLRELTGHLEALAAKEQPALSAARAALRDSRAALEDPGPAPRGERDALLVRLKSARSALYSKVQELSEAEEWRLWSNSAVQEELCARVEALREREDLDAVAKQLRELRERWKEVAAVPREEAEALWQRFKTARDAVQQRVDAHLAERAAEQADNLKQKEALCVRAEELQDSTDWARSADALKKLQIEWKEIGPVARRPSQAVWQRFRKACDHFFEARKRDLEQRRQDWSQNLEKKRALIEQAEALAESSDWDATAAELKRLQAEWKSVGPVRRNKADAIWERFRKACNNFFERYRRRDEISREADLAERQALCLQLEELASPQAVEDLAARIVDVHSRWRAAKPAPASQRAELQARYQRARFGLVELHPGSFAGTELDPARNQVRMEKLCSRVEQLAESRESVLSSAQDLASRLREALAANTIGGGEQARPSDREQLQEAEAAWSRLGPVPGQAGDALRRRFAQACERLKAVQG